MTSIPTHIHPHPIRPLPRHTAAGLPLEEEEKGMSRKEGTLIAVLLAAAADSKVRRRTFIHPHSAAAEGWIFLEVHLKTVPSKIAASAQSPPMEGT